MLHNITRLENVNDLVLLHVPEDEEVEAQNDHAVGREIRNQFIVQHFQQ